MERERFEELLYDYLDGSLESPGREELEQALEAQPDLRLEYDRARRLDAMLAGLESPAAPQGLQQAILDQADAGVEPMPQPEKPRRTTTPIQWFSAVAASLLLAVGLYAVLQDGVSTESFQRQTATTLPSDRQDEDTFQIATTAPEPAESPLMRELVAEVDSSEEAPAPPAPPATDDVPLPALAAEDEALERYYAAEAEPAASPPALAEARSEPAPALEQKALGKLEAGASAFAAREKAAAPEPKTARPEPQTVAHAPQPPGLVLQVFLNPAPQPSRAQARSVGSQPEAARSLRATASVADSAEAPRALNPRDIKALLEERGLVLDSQDLPNGGLRLSGRLTERDALWLMEQLAGGLGVLHTPELDGFRGDSSREAARLLMRRPDRAGLMLLDPTSAELGTLSRPGTGAAALPFEITVRTLR